MLIISVNIAGKTPKNQIRFVHAITKKLKKLKE